MKFKFIIFLLYIYKLKFYILFNIQIILLSIINNILNKKIKKYNLIIYLF